MNIRQIISLCVCALGLALFVYGLYARKHAHGAREEVHKLAASKNPVVKTVGQKMEAMIGGYRSKARWSLAGGAILFFAGAGGVYYFRPRSRW